MNVIEGYSYRNPRQLTSALNYSISSGLKPEFIPEKYKTQKGFNALKADLNIIISRTPVNILPEGRKVDDFGISKAEAEQFLYFKGRSNIKVASLYFTHPIEMIEPDLSIIRSYQTRKQKSYLSFKIDENKFDIDNIAEVWIHM